jgi:hypothetical protein
MTLCRSVLHERPGVFPPTEMGAGRTRSALHPQIGSEGWHADHFSIAVQTSKPTVPIKNITATRIICPPFASLVLRCNVAVFLFRSMLLSHLCVHCKMNLRQQWTAAVPWVLASAAALDATPFALLFADVERSPIERRFVRVHLPVMSEIALVRIIGGQLPHEAPERIEPFPHQLGPHPLNPRRWCAHRNVDSL